ncbi:MAG: 4Fe-4S binding protein [Candidatus Hydrothermarchaeales archaeon]
MKPAVKSRKRAIVVGAIVGAVIFYWYFQPFPWLGLLMGVLAGFLVFYALTTRSVSRFRRVFFIGLFVLTLVAIMASIFLVTGFDQFMVYASQAHNQLFFSPGDQVGVSLFPCVIQVPQVSAGVAEPLTETGAFQTLLPSGINGFLMTIAPFISPCYWPAILITIPILIIILLFGRGFCGWFCPLGGLPELFASGKRERWKMTPFREGVTAKSDLRYVGLKGWAKDAKWGILFALVMLSIAFALPLIDIFCPTLWAENIVVFWAIMGTLFVFAVVLPIMTKRKWFCLTVCPVAPVLTLLDKISFFRQGLDKEKCNKCNACVRECHMYAISLKDVAEGKSPGVDCVRCGRCTEVCPVDAIDLYWLG